MDSEGIRKRPGEPATTAGEPAAHRDHRVETEAHSGAMNYLRLVTMMFYFLFSCVCIHFQQFLGLPLYLINQDWYYAWQALAKQYFALLLITTTKWWCPTTIRVSGDKSVRGQIRRAADGRVELDFPERTIVIANHQIYTDWIFLWWSAFTAGTHGHIFIVLKESIQWIPLLGPGMKFFSFLFLSRKWETDQPRMKHRLNKLKSKHNGPLSGTSELDPMWLLIFPEGTNVSANGRASSKKWADKIGVEDLKHALLPRSRGLYFCLEELKATIDWVYDCTISYDGIPEGMYGQDIYTLKNTYLAGKRPPDVNIYWRRFAVSSIPMETPEVFDDWLNERWREKDTLLEYYNQHGRFPADEADDEALPNGAVQQGVKSSRGVGCIETEVQPNHPLQFLQIFISALAIPLLLPPLRWSWWLFKVLLMIVSVGQIRI